MKIRIAKSAENSFRAIMEFLKNKWGEKVAEAFENKSAEFLNILKDFPEIGPIEVEQKRIFGFQLTKQTRLFYRIKNGEIIILSFFDVRQNPNKKPK